MKVLMISTDQKILNRGSAVSDRMIGYGKLFEKLDIVVFSENRFHKIYLSENVTVYPTNSTYKITAPIEAIWKIKNLNFDYNIVTTQDPFETGLVGLYCKLFKYSALNVQIHTDFKSPWFIFSGIKNFIRSFVALIVLRFADSVRVVSNRIKESLKNFKKPIYLLPIFNKLNLNIRTQSDIKKPFPVTLLTVSRLEKEKNIETILKAMPKITDKAGLIIVGDGSQKERLKKIVKDLYLEDRVLFAGHQEDVGDFYSIADVYVQASLYEGYGLTLLEAATYNLPIVSTDVGLIGDVLKKSEVSIFNKKDPDDLVFKLREVISSEIFTQKYDLENYQNDLQDYLLQYKESLEL
jgi:glycosyltransferase involved in cell wall biosynthesis